jgi:hypothetical protein
MLLLFPLQDNPSLYALWPNGTCADLGLAGAHNTSLSTMLEAMVNASNPAAVAASINARLAGLMSGAAGNGSMGAAIAGQVRDVLCWTRHVLQACASTVCSEAACWSKHPSILHCSSTAATLTGGIPLSFVWLLCCPCAVRSAASR